MNMHYTISIILSNNKPYNVHLISHYHPTNNLLTKYIIEYEILIYIKISVLCENK